MDEDKLRKLLKEAFNPDPAVLNAVVKEVGRLDNSGMWDDVSDTPFTAEFVTEKLEMANRPLKASWNWWIGQLNYLNEERFGDYQL